MAITPDPRQEKNSDPTWKALAITFLIALVLTGAWIWYQVVSGHARDDGHPERIAARVRPILEQHGAPPVENLLCTERTFDWGCVVFFAHGTVHLSCARDGSCTVEIPPSPANEFALGWAIGTLLTPR